MTDFLQVVTTVDTKERAAAIARHLVERRLAACVQIGGPIESSYWWKGKIESAAEWVCMIKTRADRYQEVETEIRRVHPYEIPEILAFPVTLGSPSYLDWISKSMRQAD